MDIARKLISGRWSVSAESFEAVNPSNGSAFGTVSKATESDVREAVASAKRALPQWNALGPEKRAERLGHVVEALRNEYGEEGELTPLKRLISLEMGKRLPEADIEVIETADMLNFFVQQGPSLLEPRSLNLDQVLWPTKRSQVRFEPVGVVAVIKPWNYPLELPVWSIGAALVAGNTVVFKPSQHASFVGAEIGRIFADAGLPDGVLNVIPGDDQTGRYLVKANDVDMVSFTGSVPVGREIAVACAERHRRYSLELGGNDAAIVAPDVDIDLAANGLVWGAFANAGQVCVRPKRVFVHRQRAEELIAAIVTRTERLRIDIDLGPLVSLDQLVRVEEQVRATVAQGARLLIGGSRISKAGFYFEPTVLSEVTPEMPIMNEECFGPVMPIVIVHSVEEAVRLANQSMYGLGASIWTGDVEEGESIARQVQAGMVWVNDVNVAFPQAPWGGVKQSGPGIELGEWGLFEYVVKKHVSVETGGSAGRPWWFPYGGS